jgi:hypothetical protein
MNVALDAEKMRVSSRRHLFLNLSSNSFSRAQTSICLRTAHCETRAAMVLRQCLPRYGSTIPKLRRVLESYSTLAGELHRDTDSRQYSILHLCVNLLDLYRCGIAIEM